MINSEVKINLRDFNKYVHTRVANMGVTVGTFSENNARKKANNGESVIKINKAYGKYRAVLRSKDTTTNAEVAYSNIYGSKEKGIPKRNYFAFAFSKKFNKEQGFSIFKAFYYRQVPITDLYRRLGNLATATVKRGIKEYPLNPPNSAATIKAKGFNKPLIDTMQLLKSIKSHPLYGALEYLNQTTGEVNEL